MTGQKAKGRKPRYATYAGKEIIGLYVNYNADKSVKAYYYIDKNKRQITCTSNLPEAIRRFREYSKITDFTEFKPQPTIIEADQIEQGLQVPHDVKLVIDDVGKIQVQHIYNYSKQDIINKFLELLKENPFEVAQLSGVPQFANLEKINPLPKSQKLDELISKFLERETVSKNYKKDIKSHWREFSKIVQKQEVRQIDHKDIENYGRYIHQQSKIKSKNKERYVKNRFGSITSVINDCRKKAEYKEDLAALLSYFEQLERKTPIKKKAKVLTKEEFQTLLGNSKDSLTSCLILLGLNCAMRYTDIINLKKEEIDFEEKTIQRPRTKTGVIQSAMLWNETVKALQDYRKENPNNTDFVFATKFGNQYHEKYLRTL